VTHSAAVQFEPRNHNFEIQPSERREASFLIFLTLGLKHSNTLRMQSSAVQFLITSTLKAEAEVQEQELTNDELSLQVID